MPHQNICFIEKMSINSVVILSFTLYLASNVQGESGYMIFVFIYGILNGGFHYVFKMYIFDISQSRNFNRTWPVVQAAQGLGALIGKGLNTFKEQNKLVVLQCTIKQINQIGE